MTTIMIVCTVITTLAACACGGCCAYYKHLKKDQCGICKYKRKAKKQARKESSGS